ncbi:MAG: hypothetical protein DI539_07320 [Flavobacterium psychrophilum]|nr:MAG: hypothetical protein DI539_07320 [Flavobacterium psychrophilum]
MKFSKLLCIAVSFFALCSCHYDTTDEAIHVQYRVTVEDSILHQVDYRTAGNTIISIDSLKHMKMWHTTEFVDEDFDAHLKATFVNDGSIDQPYKLHCFVDGELVSLKEGTISPLTESMVEINYSVVD